MATQFQEGYLDELPDAKASGPIPPAQKTFQEGYLDELDDSTVPKAGQTTTATSAYGQMKSDEEAMFSPDALRITPQRLPKPVEDEYYGFIAQNKKNSNFSQKDIDNFWTTRGYAPMVADEGFIEAVRKGEETGKIDYSPWDEAQQKLEDDRMKRAMEDFSKQAYEGDYASAVDEGAQYGFWGITSRTLKDVFDTNKDALREQYPNASEEELERLSDQDVIRRARAARQYYSEANQDSEWIPWLAGQFTSAIDPTIFINPGASAGARVAAQTGVQAATQGVFEGVDAAQGLPSGQAGENILMAAGLGAVTQGLFELGGKLYQRVRGPQGEEIVEEVVNPTPEQIQSVARGVEGEEGLPGPMAMEGEAGIPGPRFTPKETAPAPTVAADRVIARVNEIAEKWTNSPEIEVVQSARELGDDVDPDALGFIGDDGKVRIIADNLQSEADIPAVLYHEALGHHGLDQKFGEGLDNLLDRMYKSEGVKKTVDDWLEANPQYKDLYAEDANPQARIVEEYLVSLGESGQLPPPNLLAAIKHYLKELGRKMKIKGLEYTDSEVMTIIGMAHNATINGKPNAISNGFRYSMEGQKFTKDTVIDDRFKREDTLLRREVKRKNTEKSYEDWQRDWEFDNFIDELEANKKPIGTTEQFEDLSGRGREGPVVQTYTDAELMERLAAGGPRYMKRKDINPMVKTLEANMEKDFGPRWRAKFYTDTPETNPRYKEMKKRYVELINAETNRTANNNRLQAPKPPEAKASDTDWAKHYLASEKYHLTKAREAEASGNNRRADDYRHRAKLDRKSASGRDPELAGEMSATDRAKYYREEAEYYNAKMEQRAARGDAAGVERYRMFRDDASKKASELAKVSLKYMKRSAVRGLNDQVGGNIEHFPHQRQSGANEIKDSIGPVSDARKQWEAHAIFGPRPDWKDKEAFAAWSDEGDRLYNLMLKSEDAKPTVKYMKKPSIQSSDASRTGDRVRLNWDTVSKNGGPGNAAKVFLKELGIHTNYELGRMPNKEAIDKAGRLGIDQDWIDYYNDATWNHNTKELDTPTPRPDMSRYLPSVKYMKRKGESEGSQTNFGRRETTAEERPYVPMGNIRSNRPGVISILEDAAPVKDRQTQAEWIAASNEVRKSAKQHQKALNPGSEPAEVLAARDSSLKLANRLTDLSVKIRDGLATENEKWQLEVGMAQLGDLLEAIDGVVSNAGRVLRSMGIEVANDAAQLAKIRALLRNKSNLSAEEMAEKLADVNFDPNAAAQIAKDNFKPSKLDYMTSIRYSAMLSGLTTPSKAIVGTMSNMLLRNASYGGSMFTGKVKPGEWQAYNLGMIRSIVEASRAFKESYGLGVASNSAINRLELQEGVNLPFSKVTEYPRRTLAGIDAFFREIIRGGEVNALAYRQALNEGFTPDTPEFEARVDYLVGLPMDEVALQLKNARTAGKKDKALIERLEEEYKLLRDIDKLATKQSNLQQLLDNDSFVLKGLEAAGRHGPVSRFVVQNTLPFARNVDNIARMAGRNSYLGLLSPYVRGELKASPERRALMISQMNVGSLLIGLAGYMGYNSLAVPSNADDRAMAAVDQAMGKTPGSIKIGDEWVSLAGLDAIAVPFITAATTAKAYKDGRSDEMSYAMATLSALNTMIKAFADETIIGQLEQFTGLFERGSNYSEFLASLPSSFMPAAVRQYTQWGEDRAVLDTRGDKSMTDRAIGRVLAGTPESARNWLIETFGLSNLPQRLDIFGRPIYREGDAVAAVTGVGRGAKEETDPVIREVDRLSQIAGKAAITKTPDDFTVDGEKVKLTPDQRMKWQYDAGQYILSDIKEAMADPVWKTLSDAEKFEEIQMIQKDAKEDAKWDNFRDILEGAPENQQAIEEEDPAVYEGYIYD